VLPSEDAAAFQALEAALLEELAPAGALQAVLAQRIVAAAWRLSRAERLEVELFAENHVPGRSLGLALIRDGNRSRAFGTLLRYRGGTLAELWRALRTLKALQAEQAATTPEPVVPVPQPMLEPMRERTGRTETVPDREASNAQRHAKPIEAESRGDPDESEPAPAANEPALEPKSARPGCIAIASDQEAREDQPHARPIEPESGGNPGTFEPAPGASESAQHPKGRHAAASETALLEQHPTRRDRQRRSSSGSSCSTAMNDSKRLPTSGAMDDPKRFCRIGNCADRVPRSCDAGVPDQDPAEAW
jgi:hypothetical protein